MRFLVDAQLPPALARLLAANGYQAEHIFDIGPRDARDIDIWEYALLHDAVIITKDEDFRNLRAARLVAPSVVWVRVGNVSRNSLLTWFAPQIPQIIKLLGGESTLIELRQLYLADDG